MITSRWVLRLWVLVIGGLLALNVPTVYAAPGVTVSKTSVNVTEGGATDSYTVVLTSEPTANVTVTVATSGGQVTLSASSLVFTPANWNTAQTVTVTAVNDAVVEGAHSAGITHAVAAGSAVEYIGVTVAGVTANITDNDIGTIVITESGGSTAVTEGGATDTYSVRLGAQPSGDVTVSIAVADGEVTLSASSLTFTTANWNTNQTVTVTAVNDVDVEGTHTDTLTHTASGGAYVGVTPVDVVVTITDNDFPLVMVTATSLNVTEGGVTATYQVRLGSRPTAGNGNVTVTPNLNTQLNFSPTSLTFTRANWDTYQTVTVSAVDDVIVEGAHSTTITHTVAGGAFAGASVDPITVNITDNDSPSVIVSPVTLTLTEGQTGTYQVRLGSSPRSGDTVSITLTHDAEVLPDATVLTFDNTNWNVNQTVIVAAVNDDIDENPLGDDLVETHTSVITHTVTGGLFDGTSAASVTVNIRDNDIAGLAVISLPPLGNVVYEGGATDGFNIRLNSEPTAAVTLTIEANTDYTASPSTLVFTPANWRTYQEVTLTAIDDSELEGTEVHPFRVQSVGAPGYTGTFVGISITVIDNDVEITVDVGDGLLVSEGSAASDSYTLALNSAPVEAVTTTISSDQCLVSTDDSVFLSSVPFTFAGTTPVPVYLRAIDDAVAEGTHTCVLSHAPTSSLEPSYSGLVIGNLAATVTDNDTAGVVVTESGGSTAVSEGGTGGDTVSVVLTSEPTHNVTVALTLDGQIGVTPAGLTFTPANWNIAQLLTINAVDDRIVEGAHVSTLTLDFDSTDNNYANIARSVAVNISDNDSAAVTFSDSSAVNSEDSGEIVRTLTLTYGAVGSGSFGLAAPLTVSITPTNQTAVMGVDYTLPAVPQLVTFPADAGQLAQQDYRYTLLDDAVDEGDETFVLTVGSPSSAVPAMLTNITASDSLTVTIENDDFAGLRLIESGGSSTVTEGGSGDSYTVSLRTLPTGTVTVTLTPDSQLTVSPTVLTFTVGDWDTPQTVTIDAVDDLFAEGAHTGLITHTPTGGGYDGLTEELTVTINDNDTRVVRVIPATLNVTEDGLTDSYAVSLGSQPTADVTITVSDSDPQVSAAPLVLTFTPTNWNIEQMVTVAAVDDGFAEGVHTGILTHNAAGGDYDGIAVDSVTVNIFDNDVVGYRILPDEMTLTEGGLPLLYTIRLTSEPSDDVVIDIFNSDSAQLTLDINQVVFTPANWNVPQTLTLTAVDDGVFEGAHSVTLTHDSSGSDDPEYAALVQDVRTVFITDGVSEVTLNGGFEIAGDVETRAASWSSARLFNPRDVRLCDAIDEPVVARSGLCAFQFNAPATAVPHANRRIFQTFAAPAWGFKGDRLTLRAYVSGNKLSAGASMVLRVVYNNGTTAQSAIAIPSGTYDYRVRTRNITLARRVQSVTITFKVGAAVRRLRIDDVTLTVTPAALVGARSAAPLPLPPPMP